MYHALHLVGQSYTTSEPNTGSAGVFFAIAGVYLAVIIFLLVSSAKVYMKAGRKWWEAIIPVYNTYVLQQIVGRPGWWTLLYFVPFVNIVVSIINALDLAKSFGQGTGTGLLLIFFPFIMYPVMAFSSKYQYQGPSAPGNTTGQDANSTTPESTTSSQETSSDTTGPQPPTSTEPAPTAPEVPTSTPPENPTK